LLGLIALIIRHRIANKKLDNLITMQISGELIYTIHCDNLDQLQVCQHGLDIDKEPTIVVLEQDLRDPVSASMRTTTLSGRVEINFPVSEVAYWSMQRAHIKLSHTCLSKRCYLRTVICFVTSSDCQRLGIHESSSNQLK